jgi:hypothetical protein
VEIVLLLPGGEVVGLDPDQDVVHVRASSMGTSLSEDRVC